jgi:hypothetical protein
MLLLLASLNSSFNVEPPPKITMHKVLVYSKPPGPPPPPMKKQGSPGSPMPSLIRANIKNPVELAVMDLDVGINSGSIGGFGIGGLGDGYGMGEGGGGGDWGTVALPELDNIPMVVSAPPIPYPEEAIKKHIQEFNVMIHIVIDEIGRAYPVSILQNPFPSINEALFKFVSSVVFTPPTKGGVPVKAEYAWPLLIKNQKRIHYDKNSKN